MSSFLNKKWLFFLSALVLLFIMLFYFIYQNNFAIAKSALSQTDVLEIYSMVSGKVVEINVDNNSQIKKGEIIAKIDSAPYIQALESAKNELIQKEETYKITKQDARKIESIISKVKEDLQDSKNKLDEANNDYYRYKNAYKDGSVTEADLFRAVKNLEVAKEYFSVSVKKFNDASDKIQTIAFEKASNDKEIKELIKKVDSAQLNLANTTIVSPVSGTVKEKDIELGSYIKKDKLILSIIPSDIYIVAKFDDKYLKNIKSGQYSYIKIKNRHFRGTVDSIDNNEVKILFNGNVSDYNLMPDLKAKVKVKLK